MYSLSLDAAQLIQFCFSLKPSEMLCWRSYGSKKYCPKLVLFPLVNVLIFPVVMVFHCRIIVVARNLAFPSEFKKTRVPVT